MAIKFDFEAVYDSDTWIVVYANAQGYQEKFLQLCSSAIKQTEFPNVDVEIQEFRSGGMFAKEVTPMLAVSFRKSQFSKLAIYFRAQLFGNVAYYTVLNTIEKSFWDAAASKTLQEREAQIANKCKNWAQVEEYRALRALGLLVFWQVVAQLDPELEKKRKLISLKDR